jgi:hypothetical protein
MYESMKRIRASGGSSGYFSGSALKHWSRDHLKD